MSDTLFPSRYLEQAVNEFAKLPGVGRKTALRLVLHLLRQSPADMKALGDSIHQLAQEIKYCRVCRNISDEETCQICSDRTRDAGTICVVETIRDVLAIESTHLYNGLYHVLGGLISPMDGIGPADLEITSLENRVREGEVKEVIMALSTTMEGDTTAFYIFRKIAASGVKITTIARGIAIGDELEYADEVTLGRSLQNRVQFEAAVKV
jgi:recombination protein RecR